jgi:hypothetical protein
MPLALVELFCHLERTMHFGSYDNRGIELSWCQISNTSVTKICAPSKDTTIPRPEIYLKKAVSQLHFPG